VAPLFIKKSIVSFPSFIGTRESAQDALMLSPGPLTPPLLSAIAAAKREACNFILLLTPCTTYR